MNSPAAIWWWLLLPGLVMAAGALLGALVYTLVYDYRQRRRDVATARRIARELLCGIEAPDRVFVESLRSVLVDEARKGGYVRGQR